MRPKGPLPRRVYWIRRALLIVVAAAVLAFGWWLVPGIGNPADTSADLSPKPAPPTGSATTAGPLDRSQQPARHSGPGSPAATPSTRQPQPSHPPKPTRTAQPSPAPSRPTGPCAPSLVRLSLAADSAPPGAGTKVRLTMSTTDGSTCTLGITPALLETRIESGDVTVWQSTTCPDGLGAKNVVVRPQPAVLYSFGWHGYQNRNGCQGTGTVASPGRYLAVAALIGGEPASASFYVTEPDAAAHQ